ncbi:universal stress protein [Arsenicicoccus sp. oral taxon 190]|uniref:universal stress protein n=1 Tax=Arsenicicoccus sp. oral taxon 190 TaxID=1658671 RepID=UPI000679F386|nr:universal stress protein [Arsenicicoccus sp. oral taxon 190]AKT50545.1 hypothetical protein ADJ73_03110 [Arsenicicoccus sp. oral taxon 190]
MTICLAYAPTEPGRAALRHCAAEARATASEVVVVNATREWRDSIPVELTHEEAAHLTEVMTDAGVPWRWAQQTDGVTGADAIIGVAEDEDVSLVVIGITDRSHVEKRIVSDTTKQVLLDAPCAVLAVRADHAAPDLRQSHPAR